MKSKLLIAACMLLSFPVLAQEKYASPIREGNEPVAIGKFAPAWQIFAVL